MKPAPFAFVRPQGLQDALEALAADPGAKVLAGGQSLVPLLSMRLAAPSTLVDINAAARPRPGAVDETGVRVGALARHAEVLRLARRTPRAAAAVPGPGRRRPRHHPQPRDGGRLAGARRRGRRAARRARRAGRPGRPRCRSAAHAPSAPTRCTPAPWSRRCGTTRSRSRRSSPPWPGAKASRSRSWPGGTATTPCAGSPRWSGSRATGSWRRGPATSRWPTCPRSSTWPPRWSRRSRTPRWRLPASSPWSTSTRPTTSTPPPSTAPSWCGC